jgi:hypothetical protein
MLVPDFESKLFLDAMPNFVPSWSPDDVKHAEHWIRDRAEMVRAGVARCPTWFQEELNKIDSRLRCWWDVSPEVVDIVTGEKRPRNEWVIDRLQDEGVVESLLRLADNEWTPEAKQALRDSATGLLAYGAYYLTVLRFKPHGEFQLNQKLLDALKAADMQQYKSPAEYMMEKRRKADQVEKSNDSAATDKALAVIDDLSDRQVNQFINASRALGTGETIIAHGDDLKMIESIQEARKKAPPLQMPKARKRRKDRIQ